MSEVTETKWL